MSYSSLGLVVMGVASFALGGCTSVGACVGTDGRFHECQQDFTPEECEDMNTRQLNGYVWAHHPDKSCPDLGYADECSFGSFRRSCK